MKKVKLPDAIDVSYHTLKVVLLEPDIALEVGDQQGSYAAREQKIYLDRSIIEEGGQRTHTILAYLNSLSEGATHFPKLGITIYPEKGKLVSFLNVDKNLALEKQSYHCGKPVFTNEKWMLTKWVRSNRTEYGTLVFGSNCK